MRPPPQKTIGLLGGCGNVATVEYDKRINAEHCRAAVDFALGADALGGRRI